MTIETKQQQQEGDAATTSTNSSSSRNSNKQAVAQIVFDSEKVAVQSLQLSALELDVATDSIRLAAPPSLLPGLPSSRSSEQGAVLILKVPLSCKVNPDTAKAKYSKKTHTLTITFPDVL